MRHYLHLGERQRRTYFADGKEVQIKKLFYAFRPAAALRWLRLHEGRAVAPMHFMTLMEESNPPGDVLATVLELIRLKSKTRELSSGPLPPEIEAFVDREFAEAQAMPPEQAPRLLPDAKAAAEACSARPWPGSARPSVDTGRDEHSLGPWLPPLPSPRAPSFPGSFSTKP